MSIEGDVAVVGSGVTGALVARGLLAAGASVTMVERGGRKPHAEQLRDRRHATGAPGAQPSHHVAPGSRDYPWNYVFGVGGSSLHWTGVTPRFTEGDLRMRSTYGILSDWPVELSELLPHYRRAERLLGVAGAPDGGGLPAHPYSPVDELLRPLLDPWVPLPQARPSRAVDGRPACCGSATCELCPVDSRFSVLNGLGDVLGHPRLFLLSDTAVERLVLDPAGRRITGVRCLRAGGERLTLRAPTVVLAAGGFENPGILLRSGLDRPDTGRYLFDHAHRTLQVRVRRDVGPGRGASLATGASEAFRDGGWRSRAAAAYVSPYNPGLPPGETLVEAILAGRRGRDAYLERWSKTVVLDVLLDDVPRADRRVTLSREKDALGLPGLRVTYGPSSPYEDRGFARVREEVERRLAPLGVEDVRVLPGPAGSHLLGTCRMGTGDDGVVDGDLRHLDVENLHVAGGSCFPTYSPAHPTLTIAALALRLGRRLVAERPALGGV